MNREQWIQQATLLGFWGFVFRVGVFGFGSNLALWILISREWLSQLQQHSVLFVVFWSLFGGLVFGLLRWHKLMKPELMREGGKGDIQN